jgi:hypothetical protein
MTAYYTAKDILALREWTGNGMQECKRAFEMAFNPELGLSDRLRGDVVWAVCTMEAGQLAVNVKGRGDGEGKGKSARDRWNLDRGARHAEDLRARDPSLNDRYPVRNTAPPSVDVPFASP